MNRRQLHLWEAIRIPPAKWQLHPWGDEGGGFWVVGIIGRSVIWYNDIEEGFNRSSYTTSGVIDEYWCNQDELEWTLNHLLEELDGGSDGHRLGPPEPIA